MDESHTFPFPVPEPHIQLVRDSVPARKHKLPEEAINHIAVILYEHQNNQVVDNLQRTASNKKHQDRLISPTLRGIKDVEKRLPEIMHDPVLCPKLLEACKRIEPESVIYRKHTPDSLGVDVLEYSANLPDDPEEALLILRQLLNWAGKGLTAIEPEPSPYPTNKKTEESLFRLVHALNDVLTPYIPDKRHRAGDIADCISLIELNYSNKTIQNLLAGN